MFMTGTDGSCFAASISMNRNWPRCLMAAALNVASAPAYCGSVCNELDELHVDERAAPCLEREEDHVRVDGSVVDKVDVRGVLEDGRRGVEVNEVEYGLGLVRPLVADLGAVRLFRNEGQGFASSYQRD